MLMPPLRRDVTCFANIYFDYAYVDYFDVFALISSMLPFISHDFLFAAMSRAMLRVIR